tara:strand:+ start:1059 stop:2048 length:990 start_codon:yes stop_codon:yes gene_type:complete
MEKTKILITGGTGYIGSCLYALLQKKFDIKILDKNDKKKWQKISKKNFYKCNILNYKRTDQIIKKIKPTVIIHLASLSTVNEKFKLKNYFLNNVAATENILKIMKKNNIKNIIYSSTASVYHMKNSKINENSKIKPISKYGKTKLLSEKLIEKFDINYIIFRFFNVASAVNNPMTGEFHNPETHLIPTLINNLNNNKISKIFGKDYKTKDGTCIRDYIHIKDICNAIYLGIKSLKKKKNKKIINLGNGFGYSNMDIIRSVNKITKKKIKFKISKKRKGDQPMLVCDIKKSKKLLNWKPKFSSLDKIIKDEIQWSSYLIKRSYKRKFLYG